MARTRVSVKNLRIGGRRIPFGIWKQVAAELLEGPEATRNEVRNGALSKASTLFELCQTDATWRKKAKEVAGRLMSAKARAYAAERGWADETGKAPEVEGGRFGIPRLPDGSIDWITRLASVLPEHEGAALLKAHKEGVTDWEELTRIRQEAKRLDNKPVIMLCGICRDPATRQLPAGLNTDKLGHYCDRHDWRGNGAGCTPAVMAMPQSAWAP